MPAMLVGKGGATGAEGNKMETDEGKQEQAGGRRKLQRNSTDQGKQEKEEKQLKPLKGGHRKLTKLMIKATLKLMQQVRDVEGALFDTLIVKASSGEVSEMTRQTKLYGDGVKEAGRNHTLGPPHIWAWGGLVTALSKRGEAIGAKNQEEIKSHLEQLEAAEVNDKCEWIRFCRCSRMYNPELRRITLAIGDLRLRQTILKALEQTGAEKKQGRGPASNMERELQQYIEAMTEGDEQ